MSFILDTCIVINCFRLRGGWDQKVVGLKSKGGIKFSIITYAELFYGTLRSNNTEAERLKLDNFIRDFEVEILPLDSLEVETYAKGRYFLEKKGIRIDNFDLLIAATAKANEAILVTDNPKHFQGFPGLKLAN